jgi:hypothetical protein
VVRPEAERPDRAAVLLDGAGENDIVQFWERNGAGGWTYLPPRWEIADVRVLGLEDFVAEHFGGGRYKVGLRDRSSGVYGKSVVLEIAGVPKPAAERAQLRGERIGGAAAAGTAAPASTRGSYELPTWVEKIMVPAAVALVAGITNKLLADPKTDPIVVELLRRTGKGDGPDALEVQRTITAAEERGERRGRELGELTARVERRVNAPSGNETNGVVDAIREAKPILAQLIDRADRNAAARAGDQRVVRRALPSPSAPSDIVPVWLRPFMGYKSLLLQAADKARSASPIAGLIIENADDATWAAMIDADTADRLGADLFAAMPELRDSPTRQAFAEQLLADLRSALREEDANDADERAEETAPAATAATAPPKAAAKKRARG